MRRNDCFSRRPLNDLEVRYEAQENANDSFIRTDFDALTSLCRFHARAFKSNSGLPVYSEPCKIFRHRHIAMNQTQRVASPIVDLPKANVATVNIIGFVAKTLSLYDAIRKLRCRDCQRFVAEMPSKCGWR